jgi:predicted secreted Zn-dependent protease
MSFLRFSLLLLISLSLLLLSRDAVSMQPAVSVLSDPRVSVRCYDIEGTTAAELREAMDSKGPLDFAGKRVDAFTLWRVDWRWPPRNNFSETIISVKVTVTMPCWRNQSSAPYDLQKRWSNFERALREHESGHVEHVLKGAAAVPAAIRSAAAKEAGLSVEDANAAADAVIRELRDFDARYDDVTKHGRNQGVQFP